MKINKNGSKYPQYCGFEFELKLNMNNLMSMPTLCFFFFYLELPTLILIKAVI